MLEKSTVYFAKPQIIESPKMVTFMECGHKYMCFYCWLKFIERNVGCEFFQCQICSKLTDCFYLTHFSPEILTQILFSNQFK